MNRLQRRRTGAVSTEQIIMVIMIAVAGIIAFMALGTVQRRQVARVQEGLGGAEEQLAAGGGTSTATGFQAPADDGGGGDAAARGGAGAAGMQSADSGEMRDVAYAEAAQGRRAGDPLGDREGLSDDGSAGVGSGGESRGGRGNTQGFGKRKGNMSETVEGVAPAESREDRAPAAPRRAWALIILGCLLMAAGFFIVAQFPTQMKSAGIIVFALGAFAVQRGTSPPGATSQVVSR